MISLFRKKRQDLQPWSQYFQNFWCFTKFSFHHKWNEAWLLVINWYIRVASRVAKLLKTSDLRKLGKFTTMSKLYRIVIQRHVRSQEINFSITLMVSATLVFNKYHTRSFAQFATICTILKTWKSCRRYPATLLKVALLCGCFSRFLNCTNGTKLRKALHIINSEIWASWKTAFKRLIRTLEYTLISVKLYSKRRTLLF